MKFSDVIELARNGRIDEESALFAMREMADGRASREEMKEFLMTPALSIENVNAQILTGLVKAVRERVITSGEPKWKMKFDIVGTGGGASTFNISTSASILLSYIPFAFSDSRTAELCVTKHGNRAVASRSGSADVLEALGLSIDLPPEKNLELLNKTRFAFLFAQKYHTAFSYVMPVRRELASQGIRTAFNIIGPLSNPLKANHQLLGFFSKDLIKTGAQVLIRLGITSALCVCGTTEDGLVLDEVSPCGVTYGVLVKDGKMEEMTFVPEDFGFDRVDFNELSASSPHESARIIRDLLSGSNKNRAAMLPLHYIVSVPLLHQRQAKL